ncbi:methylmalonyl Co-A mutase-associated GTPase MeaB [Prosthecobacter sp.]|uniref:methylmalonyl Co-A mutase-associated GTPase MeaB n=1 Tax=Prosthecobacter sp. TaxID=1965333 RepID=UPI00248913EF|nr:methylmalonyl Co-A mutase-associated GTPase MeaB [Prosthecobacter sp.]MDI1314435.1 methylmalonyl Co-A mutase-associated GTPase MeaB [Prosthecobacter sp.]
MNPTPSPHALAEGMRRGDRTALARAITLVESTREADQDAAAVLFDHLGPPAAPSFRLGVTGAPGVGKSTFIEALGLRLCQQGRRVAVLAIDPSSPANGGSLLGDKTRMDGLSHHPAAYVRPSPSADLLGGIGAATSAAVRLCEAAGYDFILIETVGIGQSERHVADIADLVLLLVDPGGGDGLQAVKRGLIEYADIIAVTKCDGELRTQAEHTLAEFTHAPSSYVSRLPGSRREFLPVSVHDAALLSALHDRVTAFEQSALHHLPDRRRAQVAVEFKLALEQAVMKWLKGHPVVAAHAQAFAAQWPQHGLPTAMVRQTMDRLLTATD